MRMIYLTLVAAAGAVLILCGGNPKIVDSGSATDVADASISGLVADTSGSPVPGTVVYLVPNGYDPVTGADEHVVETDTADSTGRFDFTAEKNDTFALQALNIHSKTRYIRSNIITENDSSFYIDTLMPPYSLTVELPENTGGLNGYVYLPGTMTASRINGETEYLLLDSVPLGEIPAAVLIEENENTEPLTLNGDLVLVDNFDKVESCNILNSITGNGGWQIFTDGGVIIEPVEALNDFTAALTSAGAYSGMSLNVTFNCDYNPYAYVKSFIWPEEGQYADLSSMTGVSFYVKGKGSVRFDIVSKKAMDYSGAEKEGQIGAVVYCIETWRKVTLGPEDLAPPPGSQQEADGLDWEAVCDSVSDITFRTWYTHNETVELWIDDIIIHGVSEEDFQR